LLGACELVAIPIEAERVEGTGAEESHHGPPPRVVDPTLRLFFERFARRRLDLRQLRPLLGQAIDHLQRGILAQDPEHLALVTCPHIENQRPPGAGARRIGRHRAGVQETRAPRELLAFEAQRLAALGRGELEAP
jgi:hypothetical protein